jgi:endogenous inhibitor of DNA gyrase (YacG/DUF329 family)
MHKVVLNPGHSLMAKCESCRTPVLIKRNDQPAPFTMAFNHPKQKVVAKCPGCQKDFDWTPEDANTVKN